MGFVSGLLSLDGGSCYPRHEGAAVAIIDSDEVHWLMSPEITQS
ncbi:hypothetical protein [Mycobacterium lepromatosis]|nr:hypothetical protein [Mycobacterium lepromatosis]